jgi:WD40 repeat protein
VAFDLKLFDAEGKLVAKEDVGYDVNGTAWSSDGKYLAAGTDAHDFRIWQLVPPQTPSRPVPAGPAYMGR